MYEQIDLDMLYAVVCRIALACALGGVIGYERERTNRPAGFRTHVLVCVGAALAMLTGEYVVFTHGIGDPSRIGAQVVSGIGFLGAGTILRAGFNVRGLTTAASLWAVSCVGLACGVGFYVGAVVSAVGITVVLVFFKRVERKGWRDKAFKTVTIATHDAHAALAELSAVCTKAGIKVQNIDFSTSDDGMIMRVAMRMPNCEIPDLMDSIATIPSVDRASLDPSCRM